DAVFFMHGGLVTGQRHHGAASLQAFEAVKPFGAQRHGLERALMLTAMGGDDGAFAQAQRLGSVLGTQALVALLRKLLTDLHRSQGVNFRGCDGVHCRVSGLLCQCGCGWENSSSKLGVTVCSGWAST